MASDGTPMLFIPPLPPIQLPADATMVIGRSRSCELRLPDADTSRRHAKLVCQDGICRMGKPRVVFVDVESNESQQ